MRNLASGFLAIAALLAATAHGQTATGQIAITVFDPSGAVVPNANVTLTGSETGELVRTLTTHTSGSANAPLLRPGA